MCYDLPRRNLMEFEKDRERVWKFAGNASLSGDGGSRWNGCCACHQTDKE